MKLELLFICQKEYQVSNKNTLKKHTCTLHILYGGLCYEPAGRQE